MVGASGGIGLAATRLLLESGRHARVIAAARRPGACEPLRRLAAGSDRLETAALDLGDEDSVRSLAGRVEELGSEPALVFNAAGLLHDDAAGIAPERRLEDLDPAALAAAFAVNAIGPLLLAKHLGPLLPRRERSVFAVLSARVGSIGDNRLGGWYAYRASKAALNMGIRTLAIELRRRAPAAVCVALHPGTVDTALSRPFRSGVPAGQLQSPDESAGRLLEVIGRLRAEDSGAFLDYRGRPIPW